MGITAFLVSLGETGLGRIGSPDVERREDRDALERELRGLDRAARLDCPHEAPPLQLEVAVWAAAQLYRIGCALAHRELDPALVWLGPPPERGTPAAAYSADLTFLHLPELARLLRAADTQDPLLDGLCGLGRDWPLSSVGMPLDGPLDLGGILDHPGLRQLYVDRVIAREDHARLAEPAIAELAAVALGAHGECLAPAVARRLEEA